MSIRTQKILSPILVLIAILILWEGLVTLFQIEQFLLPKPSAIAANLARVVVLDSAIDGPTGPAEVKKLFNQNRLILSVPSSLDEFQLTEHLPAQWFRFQLGDNIWIVAGGKMLKPILQASWFTLKEALGGLFMGVTSGIVVALATVRWVAMREALLPFAIAANSMPIIAFAPIMNNWFGIDNPFSKMAIVAIMVFFPMMLNTVRGLSNVDANSLALMHSYAASESEILRKLRMPNALPYLFSGLKVAAALSMIGAIVGEYFGGPRIALGVFITQEAALFRFASAWAAIIIACIMGISLYVIIVAAERLMMPWVVDD